MVFDGGAGDSGRAFQEGLVEQVSAVYRGVENLFEDYREAYPWVTGYLGDAFAPVWFVAENPSLAQVQRISEPSPRPELRVGRDAETHSALRLRRITSQPRASGKPSTAH